jgi:hypothetical protein
MPNITSYVAFVSGGMRFAEISEDDAERHEAHRRDAEQQTIKWKDVSFDDCGKRRVSRCLSS